MKYAAKVKHLIKGVLIIDKSLALAHLITGDRLRHFQIDLLRKYIKNTSRKGRVVMLLQQS